MSVKCIGHVKLNLYALVLEALVRIKKPAQQIKLPDAASLFYVKESI